MCKTGDLHRPGHATTIHHPASRASVGVRFAQTLVLAVGLPTAACGESEVPATELRSALPWTQVPAKERFGNNVPASQSDHEGRNDKARQKAGFALNRVVLYERDQNEPSVITGMGAGRGLSLGLRTQYIIVTHSDQK